MKKMFFCLFLGLGSLISAQLPNISSLESLPLKAIPDCDKDAISWTAQALQLIETDQADQAQLFLQQAAWLDSNCVQVKMAKAWIHFMSGERLLGFNQMNQLLEAYGPWPELVGMQITVMLAWAETGPWWKKEGPYRTYLGRNPEFPGIDSIQFTQHWLIETEKAFRFLQAKQVRPESQQMLGFAKLKMKGKNWSEAAQWLAIAALDSTTGLEVFLSLAQCHFFLNEPSKSLAYLDRALMIEPENPVIYSFQATVMKTLGDPRYKEKEALAWFYQMAPLGCLVRPNPAMIDFLRQDQNFWMKKPEKAAEKWRSITGQSNAFLVYWAVFLEPAPPTQVWAWLHTEYATHISQVQSWWMATLHASESRDEYLYFYGTRLLEFQPEWLKDFVILRLHPKENVSPEVFNRYGQLAMSQFPEPFLCAILSHYPAYASLNQKIIQKWVNGLSQPARGNILQKLNWTSFPFKG
jgi:tetratricopeptide (TPR) repeat protein